MRTEVVRLRALALVGGVTLMTASATAQPAAQPDAAAKPETTAAPAPAATPETTAAPAAQPETTAAPAAQPETTAAPAPTATPEPVAEPKAASEPPAESAPEPTAVAADEAEEAPAPRTKADELGWDEKHEASKFYFKPGKGFTVESDDGLFKLETRVRGQFRYDAVKADGEKGEQVFNLRRARVVFSGHWWGKHNTYKMELAVSPRDLGMRPNADEFDADEPIQDKSVSITRSPLLDLYTQFGKVRDFNVRVGQYKIPFSRQRVISSGNLMFVDRSIVNAEFTLDRDLGFDLRSKDLAGLDAKLRYYAGVYTGEGHSSFANHAFSSADHGFGLNTLLRLEALPFGDFKDYHESDLQRTPFPALSIGATFAHVGNAPGSRGIIGSEFPDEGTTDYYFAEADAIFKFKGFSAQTEFMFRKGERNDDGNPDPDGDGMDDPLTPARNGWGLTGQLGYLWPANVELGVRHSAVRGTGTTSLSDKNETGVVLGYYLAGHPYKVQMDYFRLYSDDLGDGEHVFRTQLQVSL